LLSRFDLLFVVLDQIDPEIDRSIASHVIRGHRYRSANGRSGHDSDDDYESEDDEERINAANSRTTSIWKRSRYSKTTNTNTLQTNHSEQTDTHPQPDDTDNILQHEFLRKYLHFAKTRFKPTLTEEAREYIASRYAEMRGRQNERTLPITARTLETVIRLASAHAKVRLSRTVEANPDCMEAMDILGFALYHENIDTAATNTTTNYGAQHDASSSPPRLERDTDENDAKRMRLDPADNSFNVTTDEAADTGTAMDIVTRIWKEVVSTGGGGMELNSICSDITDRVLVKNAVDSMAKKDKVMISEGMVYEV